MNRIKEFWNDPFWLSASAIFISGLAIGITIGRVVQHFAH